MIENEREEGLGFHRMIPIFREKINYLNIFRPYEYKKRKRKMLPQKVKETFFFSFFHFIKYAWNPQKVKEEGIYCFGGRTKAGEHLNEIRILKIGKRPLYWMKPEILGNPPQGRYGHTVNYHRASNILIIYGGRNDLNCERGDDIILDDISILNLENMNWCAVSFYGNISPRICGHSSTIVDSQLFVFGGYTTRNFVNGDLNIFELGNIFFW